MPEGISAVRPTNGLNFYLLASLYPRPSVHGEKPHPMRGDTVSLNTGDLKEYALKNNPISHDECHAYGMNGSG